MQPALSRRIAGTAHPGRARPRGGRRAAGLLRAQAEVRYAATPTDGEVAAQWRVSEVSGADDLLLVLEVSMWDLEEYTVYGSPYTPDYFQPHHGVTVVCVKRKAKT